MKKQYTMIVKDRVGVLSRITGYIRRNGWNVEKVHVEPKGEHGQSELQIELNLNNTEAARFEQRLHDWNFIFDITKMISEGATTSDE